MAFPTHIVAAAGYVFDKGGNMVIIKTLNRGYDTTGGQIEEGEDLEAGVLREIMEESGECRTSEESSEVLWVPREKVLDYITSPTLRYRFEKILNFDGKITYASDSATFVTSATVTSNDGKYVLTKTGWQLVTIPTKVAELMAMGPGVISAMVIISANCVIVNQG